MSINLMIVLLSGIHGTVAVLRKNFKILVLYNMKSWSGYGAPTDTNNVDKIQLRK